MAPVLAPRPRREARQKTDRLRPRLRLVEPQTDHSLDRERLARENMPFITRIAYRLARRLPPQVSVDDLVGAGSEGFLDALKRFDPNRGKTLQQFAEYRIRGAMLDALRKIDPLSRDERAELNRIKEFVRVYVLKHEREPTIDEIAKGTGMTPERVELVLSAKQRARALSLDALQEDEKHKEPADRKSPDQITLIAKTELKERMAQALAQLPERTRTAVLLYYYEQLTEREIADMLGVTESRVSQILKEARGKLKGIIELDGEGGIARVNGATVGRRFTIAPQQSDLAMQITQAERDAAKTEPAVEEEAKAGETTEGRIMTRAEIMKEFDVSQSTVRNLRVSGVLKRKKYGVYEVTQEAECALRIKSRKTQETSEGTVMSRKDILKKFGLSRGNVFYTAIARAGIEKVGRGRYVVTPKAEEALRAIQRRA